MDRRTYRNMDNSCCEKTIPSRRQERRVCDDMGRGQMHEDMCEKRHEDICEKERYNGDFDRFPLAMCYVPWQCFRNLYENEFEALAAGTLFKELDLRWYGRGCK